MCFNLKFRTGIVLVVLLVSLVKVSFAEDPRYLASYHAEYGLKLVHDGKIDLACERFIKALLLDSQNQTAIDQLRQISQTPDQISASKAFRIQRILDQNDYLLFLKSRYQDLMMENSRLREFVQLRLPANSTYKKSIENLEAQSQGHVGIVPKFRNLEPSNDDVAADLDNVLDGLSQKRRFYNREIDFWEQQNKQWREAKGQILSDRGNGIIQGLSEKYQSKLKNVEQQLAEKDQIVETQRHNIEYFQSELAAVRENFNALDSKFQSTDLKITELTKRIAGLSMELFEKSRIIADKDSQLSNISNDLKEAQEKINLVQRIIEEKNDRIAALEKEIAIAQIQPSLNPSEDPSVLLSENTQPGDQPGMDQLKNDFKDFQAQFKTEVDKNRKKIVQLETQLNDLNGEYQLLTQQLQEKDQEILVLNEAVQIKDLSLSKYKQAYRKSKSRRQRADQILELYRDRLIQTQLKLKQSNSELFELKNSLTRQPSGLSPKPVVIEHEFTPHAAPLPSDRDLTFLH